jgi:hypothetical protein
MDVRQRDLYISQLADQVAAVQIESARLRTALQASEDEVVRWRLKYDADMRESNDVLKRLRRMVEERDDEIRLLRARREEELAGGGAYAGASRVGSMAERLKELTLRNRELENLLDKMTKEMTDGTFSQPRKPDILLRSTAADNRDSIGRLTAGLPDQQIEINSLRVGKV